VPTIKELRDQSRIAMEAARKLADPHLKIRLASHALALALRAEIERDKEKALRKQRVAKRKRVVDPA